MPAIKAAHTAHNVLIPRLWLHPQAPGVSVHRTERLLLFVPGGRAGRIPPGAVDAELNCPCSGYWERTIAVLSASAWLL